MLPSVTPCTASFAESQRAQRTASPSTSSSSVPAPAATQPPSARASSACGSRSSTTDRPASAAPACTGAASPPRPCSSRPTCTTASCTPASSASSVGEPGVDATRHRGPPRSHRGAARARASTASSRRTASTYVRGRGRLEGPQQVRVATVDEAGDASGEVILHGPGRHPGHRLARQVAAGPRARRQPHRHQRRRAALVRTCRAPSSSSVPARSAWSSPATTTTWAARSRCSSTCPPSCRSRTPRSPRRWSAPSSGAASGSSPAPASTRPLVVADESGVRLMVGQGRGGARGAARRAAARGHRPRCQHGRRGPGDDARRGRAGPRQGRRPDAHGRSAPLRHRRHHRRPVAGPRGRARGHRRGACHRRAARSSRSTT